MNIISSNSKKVKYFLTNNLNNSKSNITKPVKKFIGEFAWGMLATGNSNQTDIARAQTKSNEKIKHVVKRFQRMLKHEEILNFANKECMKEVSKKINENTIIALDGGDISHVYGEKFENISKVHDGSQKGKNKISKGYWLQQASGYDPETKETFPIFTTLYSTEEKNFKSENIEALNVVDNVIDNIGTKGIWVMDRGYDRNHIIKPLLEKNINFIIRMTKRRDIFINEQKQNIYEAACNINRRYTYKKGKYNSKKVILKINNSENEMTLIVYKYKNRFYYFLANGWIKKTKRIKQLINAYIKRWCVEESFRFEKQSFNIEKARTIRFSGIKALLGLTLFCWLIVIKCTRNTIVKEELIFIAKMEKTKLKYRPKFIYYQILKGIQRCIILSRTLLSFHKNRKSMKHLQLSLFNDLFLDLV